MAKIAVPRAELIELLGLAPDVDDATLQKAMTETAARQEAKQRAAAERPLKEADKGLVAAAIKAGKISASHRKVWLDSLGTDRQGTQRVIASLPTPPRLTSSGAADPELERVHNQVMASLGFTGKGVAANASPHQSDFGRVVGKPELPPGIPAPVRLVRGKPPEQWSQREKDDALQRQLGPAFWPGTKPAPGGDGWYFPSPNDHSEFIDHGDGTGHWQEKSIATQPYRVI
jgi:hypothetical protein